MKAFAPLAALIALAACSPAAPPSYTTAGVEVVQPFSRPAAAGGTGAGFFTLTNRNTGPDVLVAVESPISARVEIHETSTEGGMMRMQELKDGVPIKAGQTVALQPGGKHLMFIGLKAPLKTGDRIPATLVFEKAGRTPVELVVRDGGALGSEGKAHDQH